MPGDAWGELVEQIRVLMRSTKHLAHRHLELHEGLGPALGGTLAVLAREGPMRLTELAEQLYVDPSVASRQAAELVGGGLVVRSPDPGDARAGLLDVTDEGRAVLERTRDRRAQVLAGALGDWRDDDTTQLVALLTRLNGDFRRALCAGDEHAPADTPHLEGMT